MFNSNGTLISKQNFYSEYEFKSPELLYINSTSQYILITTSSSVELYDIKNNAIISSIKETLSEKKGSLNYLGSNQYYYAYNKQEESKHYLCFVTITINTDISPPLIKKTEKKIESVKINEKTIIDCANTNDRNIIICSYFNEENLLEISSFSNDFSNKIATWTDNTNPSSTSEKINFNFNKIISIF